MENSTRSKNDFESFTKYWEEITTSNIDAFNLRQLPPTKIVQMNEYTYEFDKNVGNTFKKLVEGNASKANIVLIGFLSIVCNRYLPVDHVIINIPANTPNEFKTRTTKRLPLIIKVDREKSIASHLNLVKDGIQRAYNYQKQFLTAITQSKSDHFKSNVFCSTNEFNGQNYNQSQDDLNFNFLDGGNSLKLQVTYNELAVSAVLVENFVRHLSNALTSLKDLNTKIKSVSIYDELDIGQLKSDVLGKNGNNMDVKLQDLIGCFECQVATHADAIAIDYYNLKYTYGELNNKANALAAFIKQNYQIQTEAVLGVLMDNDPFAIISILGILKAGAAYLPIDPSLPTERKLYLLEQSASTLVLTNSYHMFDIPDFNSHLLVLDLQMDEIEEASCRDFAPNIEGNNLAYMIYTSGSTGFPKGVMVEHASIVNTCLDQIKRFKLSVGDRALQFAKLSFDASVYEIFNTLLSGATLVMIKEKDIKDTSSFMDYIKSKRVNMVTLPPVYLNRLPLRDLGFIDTLVTAGEAAIVSDALICAKNSHYFNAYGPTECAVCVSIHALDPGDKAISSIPIGKPLQNTYTLLLDEYNELVPKGMAGELHVGGKGLARGYINDPKSTYNKFIAHPYFENERLYKTGDIVRILEDGEMEYLGRKDFQVKIRGFRIELGELESCLKRHPSVADCAVILKEKNGNKALIAFWKSSKISDHQEQHFKKYLSSFLPEYMIPSLFIRLEKFPMTSNGKIDRKKLSKGTYENQGKITVNPRTNIEKSIVDIWKNVLMLEKVGIQDNFFELGGNSINAIKVMDMILEKYPNSNLQISDLFTYNNIEQLAAVIPQDKIKLNPKSGITNNNYSKIDL